MRVASIVLIYTHAHTMPYCVHPRPNNNNRRFRSVRRRLLDSSIHCSELCACHSIWAHQMKRSNENENEKKKKKKQKKNNLKVIHHFYPFTNLSMPVRCVPLLLRSACASALFTEIHLFYVFIHNFIMNVNATFMKKTTASQLYSIYCVWGMNKCMYMRCAGACALCDAY